MVIGADGQVKEKLSLQSLAEADFHLKTQSKLVADILLVKRRETVDLVYLTKIENSMAQSQWGLMRQGVLREMLKCTGPDAVVMRGMQEFWDA